MWFVAESAFDGSISIASVKWHRIIWFVLDIFHDLCFDKLVHDFMNDSDMFDKTVSINGYGIGRRLDLVSILQLKLFLLSKQAKIGH